MKQILSLFIIILPVFAQPYNLRTAANQTASSGAFSAGTLGDYTLEFRLTKRTGTFGAGDAGFLVFNKGHITCSTVNTTISYYPFLPVSGLFVQCQDSHDQSSNFAPVPIDGLTDARIRFTRLTSKNLWIMESNDGAGGSYTLMQWCGVNVSSPAPAGLTPCTGSMTSYTDTSSVAIIGDASHTLTFDIGFVRWASGSSHYQTKAPVEAPSTPYNYAEWNLENSLVDTSGNSHTLSMNSGSATFVAAPTYNPTAGLSPGQIFGVVGGTGSSLYAIPANQNYTLGGSTYAFSSTNLNGNPTSYLWSVTAIPTGGDGTLSSTTSATPTITLNDVFGTYYVHLAVTDGSGTGTITTKLGAVPENTDHTLKYYVNPQTNTQSNAIEALTGRLVRWGTSSAFETFDNNWMASFANPLTWTSVGAGTYPAWPPLTNVTTPLPGTGHVVGSFPFVFTCETTCNFNSNFVNGDVIAVWFPLPTDSPGVQSARCVYGVNNPTATTIELVTGNQSCPINTSGYHYSKLDGSGNNGGFGQWNGSNDSWNYYDNSLAAFRLYLETGIDDFLNLYRTIADTSWLYVQAAGYQWNCFAESRCDALIGGTIRAIDGNPGWWPGILFHLSTSPRTDVCATTVSPVTQGTPYDPRDTGYNLGEDAAVAIAAAHNDGTPDTTTRATYCTYVKQCINNIFTPAPFANGLFATDFFSSNPSFPYAGGGTQPFMQGLANGGLRTAADVMTQACSNISDRTTVAASANTALKTAETTLFSYTGSNLGSYGQVNYTAQNLVSVLGPGTVDITHNTTAILGHSTSFLNYFTNDGQSWIGVVTGGIPSEIVPVASVTDNTHMTLASNWPYTTVTGAQFAVSYGNSRLGGTGTVSINNGGTQIVGSGTTFTQNFLDFNANAVQTFIDVDGNGVVYLIKHVIDDTHMTICDDFNCAGTYTWTPPTLTNVAYTVAKGGTTLCGPPSTATTCSGWPNSGGWQPGDRPTPDLGLNNEIVFGMGYIYSIYGTGSYLTNGDLWFHATFDSALPYASGWGKRTGQEFGAGGNPMYLAYRVANPACSDLTFTPSSVSGIAASGGSGVFDVTVTDQTCSWSLSSSASWLTCTANCSGTGNQSGVAWAAAANATFSPRSATLSSGINFTVNQLAASATGPSNYKGGKNKGGVFK